MSNILCNSQFFHQRFGGVTRYSLSLIEKMIHNEINFKICAPIYKNNYIKKIKNKYIFGAYFSKYPNILLLRYINNSLINFYLKDKNKKLVHFMYDPEYLPKNVTQKKIITIHDTIHEKFNKSYKDNFFLKRKKILEQMDKIICVSENTKKDLMKFYNLDNKKVSVIYNGADHLNFIATENKNIVSDKPYILYVGSRAKYKNFRLFVESFKKSEKLFNNFNIICFGGGYFSKSEINYFKELNILNKIILVLGDDKSLKIHYENASLFVYPSLYEGFGISILEAINVGCPALASDIPVFREILGDKMCFFNPKSHEDLIFNMEKILFDSENQKNLITIGKKISEKYSWSICYNHTIGLYN